jgi:uncharacterized membrane protein
MIAATLDIFSQFGGEYLSRWSHVFVGIAWIGLLYYFNFVQVPSFAEMDAAARNDAIDKLASRALWWFRWAAAATVVTGLLILAFQENYDADYFKTAPGISIATGVLLALTMFANVWLVIWPKQKIVIANARNVAAGGEADPSAAAEGRKALLASRMNMIFSIPMLWFMVGTSHFPYDEISPEDDGQRRAVYWIVVLVLWAILEINALGRLGGTAPGGPRVIYDTHRNAIVASFVLTAIFWIIWEVVLRGHP